MDPFGVIVLCLLLALALVGKTKKKGKPFLAWVVNLAPAKKKRGRKR